MNSGLWQKTPQSFFFVLSILGFFAFATTCAQSPSTLIFGMLSESLDGPTIGIDCPTCTFLNEAVGSNYPEQFKDSATPSLGLYTVQNRGPDSFTLTLNRGQRTDDLGGLERPSQIIIEAFEDETALIEAFKDPTQKIGVICSSELLDTYTELLTTTEGFQFVAIPTGNSNSTSKVGCIRCLRWDEGEGVDEKSFLDFLVRLLQVDDRH